MDVAKAASAMVRQLKLNTGAHMPIMSIGFLEHQYWGDISKSVSEKAIDLGYRHFENAEFDLKALTKPISDCFEKGLCKREDLFISSKMACKNMFPDRVQASLAKTLAVLKTDYLDLYLVPWPHRLLRKKKSFEDFSHIEKYHEDWMNEFWSQLETLVDNGTVKAIGVSNFTIQHIDNLIANCKIPPAVNRVENNLYFQQHLMKRYLDSKNILMQAYGPVGVVSRRTTDNEKFHSNNRLQQNETLQRIAMKYGVSTYQICLAFLMAEDRVVLTKCGSLERMEENMNSVKIKLTDQDIQDLRQQDRNLRRFSPRFLIPHSLHVNFWGHDYDLIYEEKVKLEGNNQVLSDTAIDA